MNGIRLVGVGLMLIALQARAAEEKPAATKPDAGTAEVEKPDAERIAGVWKIESADGPFELLQNANQKGQAKFADGKLEFKVIADGNPLATINADYVLDEKQTPKLLDLTLTGDGGGKPVFLIYELKGDKLRLRFNTDGDGARPADFAVPDEKCRILTLVRDKDAK